MNGDYPASVPSNDSSSNPVSMLLELWNGPRKVATRYLVVSAINTLNHQLVLFVANSVWNWTGGWANAFAACVAALPAYLMSRAWVWEVSGRHSLRREVIPFWTIALVGLIVSTLFAEAADRWFGAGLVVNFASLVGYFVVWVGKFLLLDRLFTSAPATLEEGAA